MKKRETRLVAIDRCIRCEHLLYDVYKHVSRSKCWKTGRIIKKVDYMNEGFPPDCPLPKGDA